MMNWINEFYLMNKDQRVLTFRMEKNEFDEVTFKEVKEERLKILEELIDKQIYNILHDIRLYVPVEFPEVQPPFQNTNVDANNNEKKDIKTADIEIEK